MANKSSEDSFEITYTKETEYLYVRAIGDEDTFQKSYDMWSEIATKCREWNYQKVLLVEEVKTQLSILDMHKLTSALPRLGFLNIKIAFVDEYNDQFEGNEFGETVATNRGIKGKIFKNEAEAKKWLLSD